MKYLAKVSSQSFYCISTGLASLAFFLLLNSKFIHVTKLSVHFSLWQIFENPRRSLFNIQHFYLDMSMDMQRSTLKTVKSLATVKGRETNRKRRNPITLSAWTAATTVYFGECPSLPTYLCLQSGTCYGALQNTVINILNCQRIVIPWRWEPFFFSSFFSLIFWSLISYLASYPPFSWLHTTNNNLLILSKLQWSKFYKLHS